MYNLRNLVMIGLSLNSVQLFTSDASQTHKTIVCCMSGGVWSMSGGVWWCLMHVWWCLVVSMYIG